MEPYYLLKFRTDTGSVVTIRVPYATEVSNTLATKSAMDKIIATGIVDVIEGKLIAREAAEHVSTIVSDYALA